MNTSEMPGKQARAARGVLLRNPGTPESLSVADVRRYLREFLWKPACGENVAPAMVAGAQPGESPYIYGGGW